MGKLQLMRRKLLQTMSKISFKVYKALPGGYPFSGIWIFICRNHCILWRKVC
jgi:hypothetical protein